MFDIGFGELLVIGVLGLLVLGPERLPVAVKTLGLWLGRFKRSYRQVRSEIEKEIGADEIRRQLHNEDIMHSLQSSKEELENFTRHTQHELNNVEAKLKQSKAELLAEDPLKPLDTPATSQESDEQPRNG